MKRLFVLSLIAFVGVTACAQEAKEAKPAKPATMAAQQDKSKRPSPPAITKETTAQGNTIVIDYSQPAIKGRKIGGEIAPFGEVWRTGANEPTSIELSKDSKINDQGALPAGKYSIYTIPGENEWVVIFNKNYTDGANTYSEENDVLRITVPVDKTEKFVERMKFDITQEGMVILSWGDTAIRFSVTN